MLRIGQSPLCSETSTKHQLCCTTYGECTESWPTTTTSASTASSRISTEICSGSSPRCLTDGGHSYNRNGTCYHHTLVYSCSSSDSSCNSYSIYTNTSTFPRTKRRNDVTQLDAIVRHQPYIIVSSVCLASARQFFFWSGVSCSVRSQGSSTLTLRTERWVLTQYGCST